MSKVFNMVSGGGKNISSIIITGLKSTDTVTCTKDGKSYAATWDETAQHFEIVGLPLGTFTITATRGTETTTETVLIDIIGVYEIEMSFKLWLYRDGDECEDITGGWSQRPANGLANASITKTSTSISWTINISLLRIATNNKIDLTNYKKLVFQCKQTVNGTVGGTAFIYGVCSNPTASTVTLGNEGNVAKSTDKIINTTHETTNIEVNISEITGSYYPYVRIDAGTSGLTITGVLYKVWLE